MLQLIKRRQTLRNKGVPHLANIVLFVWLQELQQSAVGVFVGVLCFQDIAVFSSLICILPMVSLTVLGGKLSW